ncbi:Gfo/Idh/MocA family oxidoreductase [Aliifodinibius sp. S!AR15-10]|uniref:Gfo/Idh/MocA family protein n=1 Tax=Aliifodinibius sp. S!AR15-10 TaxID=2950437 RepID=UPI00285E6AFE|nr:Gfo/Idh/MocA family oxidoreductase [Aliifodinibius sp. S!AR15-10]MDR8389914.1 Gfo/Idh/MocA family oxidoreductase [Aliifodinibius sp. S!AR15-10]
MENKKNTRREFLKKIALGTAGVSFGLSAKSYGNIIGANDRLNVAIMGVNGRGSSLAENFVNEKNTRVTHVCDVEEKALAKGVKRVINGQSSKPEAVKDFRNILDNSDVDALVIAAPDHWHAPAGILACDAGKHVYVEKPCSHNPGEGELLVQAARKNRRVVQMGNQRRSWPHMIECMEDIKDGIIGHVYFAKGWYANDRGPIGVGKQVPVPGNLDYELWQGPAPRRAYKDNLIHYNWHWFWNWGTGEACNNGTHEIDVMRWGLNVDYPIRVSSSGGRYHYSDDWETPDTQVIGFDFKGEKSLTWEGRSCNSYPIEGSGRGVQFFGEKGTIVITGGNEYSVYNKNNELVKEVSDSQKDTDTLDTTGPGVDLDSYHIHNFLESIRGKAEPTAEIEKGHKSVLLCHLGNIAQRVGRNLNCNPENGHIIDDHEAMALWEREYEPGWKPRV